MHIALAALRRYKFHSIWWLVSPQNPLKSKQNSFVNRLKMTRRFIQKHPQMLATDIETKMGIEYSYQTVEGLQKRFPQTRFTWIAGMDNARLFHRWDRWKDLLSRIPFVFFNRPPCGMAVRTNAVRMVKGTKHVRWDLKGKTRNISSTRLRQKRIAHFLQSKL
jgi:nicotinate-nucleotide adenylyltransferase